MVEEGTPNARLELVEYFDRTVLREVQLHEYRYAPAYVTASTAVRPYGESISVGTMVLFCLVLLLFERQLW